MVEGWERGCLEVYVFVKEHISTLIVLDSADFDHRESQHRPTSRLNTTTTPPSQQRDTTTSYPKPDVETQPTNSHVFVQQTP